MFNSIQTNPASGGANFATEQFTQSTIVINLPVTGVVFGPSGGPFTLVGDGGSFPVSLTDVSGLTLTLGQKSSVTSLPVVLANDQSPLVVSVNNLSTTNLALETGGNLQTLANTVSTNKVNIQGTVTAITTGLALDTSVAGILISQGFSGIGVKGPLIQGLTSSSTPLYTVGDINPISLTTAGAIRVDGSSTIQPVSGTITVNAGTNLNTSLLALENGNLATLNNKIPNLGQANSLESVPVVIANNQSVIPVSVQTITGTFKISSEILIALAAGGTGILRSAQITSSKTANLIKVTAASSVPFKITLYSVNGGILSNPIDILINENKYLWESPEVNFVTEPYSGSGFDGFQATVVNLDPGLTADVYTTFYYNET